MYKFLGVGLLGLFALLAVPAIQQEMQGTYIGGMATMVVHNAQGEEIMFQQVHNRIVDSGEDFIVRQIIANQTNPLPDAQSVGLICPIIRAAQDINFNDSNTTLTFIADNENSGGGPECLGDPTAETTGGGIKRIGDAAGLSFQGSGGNDNIGTNNILRGIGVFTNSTDIADLGAGNVPILFALIDTSDVTVAASDTVNISYTFNISDDAN